MTDDLRYIKNLSRTNYWNFPAINPLALFEGMNLDTIDSFAHQELSADCQQFHEAGNTEVIFEYVKKDILAFRAPWVVDQIEQWRLENTPESRDKLHRLMRAYTDERGHDPLPEIVRLILRDQAIFKEIVDRNQRQKTPLKSSKYREGCFAIIAKQHNLSEESIEEIYKVYKSKADELMGKKEPRLLSPHLFQKRHNKVLQDALNTLDSDKRVRTPVKPVFASWEEFFQWLDEMATRLSHMGG